MVAQVNIRHGLVITLPQLDGIRTKLGLTTQMNRPQAAPVESDPTPKPWQKQSPILRSTHPTPEEPDLSQVLGALEDDEALAGHESGPSSQANVPRYQETEGLQSDRVTPLDPPDQTSMGAMNASPTSFQDRLPSYDISSSSIFTLSVTSKAQAGDDQFIARRFHAAFILHAFGAFDQAFDMFSLIFNDLHTLSSDASAPDPRLPLSVVSCTWSARTPSRLEVTRILVNEVYRIFTAHYGGATAVLEDQRTWRHLNQLHQQLSRPNGLPNRLISESTETAAHWLAISCRLSHPELDRTTLLSKLLHLETYGADEAYHHARRCTDLLSTIRANLAEFYDFISENRRSIDHSVGVYCSSQPLHCEFITQSLACLFLEHKTRNAANLQAQEQLYPSCVECLFMPLDIPGLVPVILPRFLALVIERLYSPALNIVSGVNMPGRDRYSSLLCAAVRIVSTNNDFSSPMVDLFLDLTMPGKLLAAESAGPPTDKQSLGDRMVFVAGLLSGLIPTSETPGQASPSIQLDECNEDSRAKDTLNSAQTDVTTPVTEVPVLFEKPDSSTASSEGRLFRATSTNALEARRGLAPMEYIFGTTSSEARSSHSDYRFSVVTGLPSDSSVRHSDRTDHSDLQSIREGVSSDMSDVLTSG